MQVVSITGSIVTNQDFIIPSTTGDVVQCVIGHIFVNQRDISELLFPKSLYSGPEDLVLEMSMKLWKAQQKCAFSNLLPWVVADPPDWVEPKTEYLSSNKHGTKYVPEHMLFGEFEPGRSIFRIQPTTDVLPDADIMIRRTYGSNEHYHGMTSAEAASHGFAAFQKIPIHDDRIFYKGIEYWILKHPV